MQNSQRVFRWILWVSLLTSHTGFGQIDIQAIEASLKGQQKALLNFSADPIARYSWKNSALESERPAVRTLAIFITDSISQAGSVVELAGQRATLVFDSKLQALGLSVREPMKLQVDLTGTTPADVLPKLADSLFFSSLKDAVAGAPKELADRLPYVVGSEKSQEQLGPTVYLGESWQLLGVRDPRYKRPSIVSAPRPEFTEEARRRRYNGTETLYLKVSEAGQPGDLWVACPADYGLNSQSISALRRYVFKPATVDGKPAAAIVRVEMKFMMH